MTVSLNNCHGTSYLRPQRSGRHLVHAHRWDRSATRHRPQCWWMHIALQTLADRNGGVFTRQDARAVGLAQHHLTRLVRTGAVARLRRGIYAAPSVVAGLREPWLIAQVHCVVLSFWSAAAWWGVDLPAPLRCVHVTAPRTRGTR